MQAVSDQRQGKDRKFISRIITREWANAPRICHSEEEDVDLQLNQILLPLEAPAMLE